MSALADVTAALTWPCVTPVECALRLADGTYLPACDARAVTYLGDSRPYLLEVTAPELVEPILVPWHAVVWLSVART